MHNHIELYRAIDRRCYNGAYCSDLQKEIDSKNKAKKYLKSLGLSICYYPAGSYYIGFGPKYKILTKECTSFREAANLSID